MWTREAKEQAIAAIRAANPSWTDKEIRYALEHKPSPWAYCYPDGSPSRGQATAAYTARLKEWLAYVLAPNPPIRKKADWCAAEREYDRLYAEVVAAGPSHPLHAKMVVGQGKVHTNPSPKPERATPAPATGGTLKAGTKKGQAAELMARKEGATPLQIAEALGVTEAAARALIGDVKKVNKSVVRDGNTYYIR